MDTGDLELVRHEIQQSIGGIANRIDEISMRTSVDPDTVRMIVREEIESLRAEMSASVQAVAAHAEDVVEAAEDAIEDAVETAVDALEDAEDAVEDAVDDVGDAIDDAGEQVTSDVDEGVSTIDTHVEAPIEDLVDSMDNAPRRTSAWHRPLFQTRK
jgi:prophage DNA circulation protein